MIEEYNPLGQSVNDDNPVIMVDLEKCIRCRSCERACKLENIQEQSDPADSHKSPTFWQRLEVVQVGPEKESKLPIFNVYMGCNHCEYPACIASCPVKGKAIEKRGRRDSSSDCQEMCRVWIMRQGVPIWHTEVKRQKEP